MVVAPEKLEVPGEAFDVIAEACGPGGSRGSLLELAFGGPDFGLFAPDLVFGAGEFVLPCDVDDAEFAGVLEGGLLVFGGEVVGEGLEPVSLLDFDELGGLVGMVAEAFAEAVGEEGEVEVGDPGVVPDFEPSGGGEDDDGVGVGGAAVFEVREFGARGSEAEADAVLAFVVLELFAEGLDFLLVFFVCGLDVAEDGAEAIFLLLEFFFEGLVFDLEATGTDLGVFEVRVKGLFPGEGGGVGIAEEGEFAVRFREGGFEIRELEFEGSGLGVGSASG